MSLRKWIVSLFLCVVSSFCSAGALEVAAGGALNLPAEILVAQQSQANLSVDAQFDTESLIPPIYYQIRLIVVQHRRRYWEMEFIHNKIYLRNPPPEIQSFSVSHGFNMFGVNHVRMFNKCCGWRLGGGVILAHPENTVRGAELTHNGGVFGWGYYLSGAYLASGFLAKHDIGQTFYLVADLRLSSSYASIPIRNGQASLFLNTLHLAGGIGARW
ncbi:MAG: hypothetical protein OEZ43_18815 [Gammaproteobacteria bacterium]|nr:hypothetical protein [Gammaproteobacteria bacterium]